MKTNTLVTTLALLLLLSGCGGGSGGSSDTNNNTPANSNQTVRTSKTLTPPEWIQGTWMDRSEPLLPSGWLFTANDMYTIVGENSISLMETGVQSNDTIEQQISSTRYSFTIHHTQLNSTETFTFNKLSDTQINFEDIIMGGTTGPFIKE
jgi:hypothetical protein